MGCVIKYLIGIALLLFGFTISNCGQSGKVSASKQVKCAKPKKSKNKRFATKRKSRKRYTPVASGGGATRSDAPAPAPAPKPDPVQTATEPEPPPPSIPETKVATQEVIEFRGETIDLGKEDYSFDEQIAFIENTDSFLDREGANDAVKDLTKLLRKNKNIKVTIVGNTATEFPQSDVLYGNSEQALNQEGTLNMETVRTKDVMIARAKKIYDLLVRKGVNQSQLQFTHGSHYSTKEKRVVTFILKSDG